MTTNSQLTVAVRIRPLNDIEKQRKSIQCVHPLDNQEEVHAATTAPLMDFVVAGYNATVFAYGPTGSGKTYTMVGQEKRPGLMMLLTRDLYEKINPHEFTVYLSYLEIYNEVIRDLLNPNAGVLDLLEDERGNVQVPGLSRVKAPNTSRIMQILQEGNSRRTQEPTAANKNSSRSHALLQVTLYKNSVQHGKLFLIDLAGSERASQTQNRGKRLKEGAAINRSLLALGNVINALSTGSKGRYVNYRDSKLTRLLKDSLGGNSKTCMIAHVTPSSFNYDETYNTLVYANRAKNITTRIAQNRPASADQQYVEAIKEMQKDALRKSNMVHAVSSVQLSSKDSDKSSSTSADREPLRPILKWNNSVNPTKNGPTSSSNSGGNNRFASLFNALKGQYLANTEKQHKLREKLLKANHEAYDVEMSRMSKMAILTAWEKHNKEADEKYSDVIERLKVDVTDQETRLAQLHELRLKIEKALRKGEEVGKSLESRMRALAKDPNQKEVIDFMLKMGQIDAEKMAIFSDSALQRLRLRKQENSLQKIQKYEQIADKLINSDDDGSNDHEKDYQEYRIFKNQLNYHLIPLRRDAPIMSWNSQFLARNQPNELQNALDLQMSNTFSINDFQLEEQKKKRKSITTVHLPRLTNTGAGAPEVQSDYGTDAPSTIVKLPPINASPV
uniref:Kinesin-like protein n=1 Tax=Panagrellus redivivus TaxID=6233 RepID=A0A7E4V304_PANRE